MNAQIFTEPLTCDAFAPFGDVLEAAGSSFEINAGRCDRFHDLARLEFLGEESKPILSVFRSRAVTPPYELPLMERHPLGSQAFAPLHERPFLVTVAPDVNGAPGRPRAFLTQAGQGVNILRNVWHGPLTPLERESDFLVIDRGGDSCGNLEEHQFEKPYIILNGPAS